MKEQVSIDEIMKYGHPRQPLAYWENTVTKERVSDLVAMRIVWRKYIKLISDGDEFIILGRKHAYTFALTILREGIGISVYRLTQKKFLHFKEKYLIEINNKKWSSSLKKAVDEAYQRYVDEF